MYKYNPCISTTIHTLPCICVAASPFMFQFAVLIGIILVCEIGAGIAAFVLKGKVDGLFTEGLKDTLKDYKNNEQTKKDWDNLQKEVSS